MGHFVLSPREREKRDRIVEEMKKRDRERKRKMNESEETEEITRGP